LGFHAYQGGESRCAREAARQEMEDPGEDLMSADLADLFSAAQRVKVH